MTNTRITGCGACGAWLDSIYEAHECAPDALRERAEALIHEAREQHKAAIVTAIESIVDAADGYAAAPALTIERAGTNLRHYGANIGGAFGSRLVEWAIAMAAPFGVIIGEPCSAGLADGEVDAYAVGYGLGEDGPRVVAAAERERAALAAAIGEAEREFQADAADARKGPRMGYR